ncbi:L,D-transpeptidase [Actinomycetospora termitidis]|uniref:L,D-transpeptidase n=1 Tax=Actinomycetospora termitidis TaxID=3053470 RepID=A0ABT7M182_9PSEU|nr:L,D-transpeptidase [Actinomycetospora sp. Odt1-22]MDL5154417.1 L,D-transpeptidase [Actinomycetospora sp. Odt1-22]
MGARHRRARNSMGLRSTAVVAAAVAVPAVVAQPAVAGPATGPDRSTPCAASADVCVDLSRHRAWLLDDGTVTEGPVPVTTGSRRNPTPTGTFHVQRKDRDHVSKEVRNAAMPWSVFFDDQGRALHGGSLSRASAGCIHLDDEDARTFFDALHPGDEVQIVE